MLLGNLVGSGRRPYQGRGPLAGLIMLVNKLSLPTSSDGGRRMRAVDGRSVARCGYHVGEHPALLWVDMPKGPDRCGPGPRSTDTCIGQRLKESSILVSSTVEVELSSPGR